MLDRLRATFLSDERTAGPYWHTVTDLECYDRTYGERIGWKWDAVLRELRLRGWRPPGGTAAGIERHRTLLDWGCGSGVASRRVLQALAPAAAFRLVLHDHSNLAVDYAEHRARAEFPGLAVARADVRCLRGNEPIDVLVISHVLNELDDIGRADLAALLARARSVLWVEPGTHDVSRALLPWREQARAAGLALVAPCPHAGTCGLLAPGNERHWCHFFADPPPGVHADSGWVKFGQRAGIDLRSLPYSYLVLERTAVEVGGASRPDSADSPAALSFSLPPAAPVGAGAPSLRSSLHPGPLAPSRPTASPTPLRFLGHPRFYKGYARLFTCTADGVRELTLQKRDAPDHFKSLKRGEAPAAPGWIIEGDRLRPPNPSLPTE